MKNFMKILMIGCVIFLSYFAAAYFVNEKMLEVSEKSQTVAAAMMKAKTQEGLKEADKIIADTIKEEMERQNEEAASNQENADHQDTASTQNTESTQNAASTQNTASNQEAAVGDQANLDLSSLGIETEKLEMKEPEEHNLVKDEDANKQNDKKLNDNNGNKQDENPVHPDDKTDIEPSKDSKNTSRSDTVDSGEGNPSDSLAQDLPLTEEDNTKSQKDSRTGFGDHSIFDGLLATKVAYYELPEADDVTKRSIISLTQEELFELGSFLESYYFLDGQKYYMEETNPKLQEKKKMVYEMESYMTVTYESLDDLVMVISSGDFSAVESICDQLYILRDEFVEKYEEPAKTDEHCRYIYLEIRAYLKEFIEILDYLKDMGSSLTENNNMFSYALIMMSIQEKIFNAIPNVMNRAVDTKEDTNTIYLIGVDEVVLLHKDDVVKVINNPGLILKNIN